MLQSGDKERLRHSYLMMPTFIQEKPVDGSYQHHSTSNAAPINIESARDDGSRVRHSGWKRIDSAIWNNDDGKLNP